VQQDGSTVQYVMSSLMKAAPLHSQTFSSIVYVGVVAQEVYHFTNKHIQIMTL
jgi:superfamily I DNA/RNA helicase